MASFQGGLAHQPGRVPQRALGSFRAGDWSCAGSWASARWSWPATSPARSTQQDFERVARVAATGGRAGRPSTACGWRSSFKAGPTFANNLQTAAALVAETGSPHLGMCLDVFHYYIGPSKPEDLGYLTTENLFHVQLCDLAGQPRELATDARSHSAGRRRLSYSAPIVEHLRQIGYAGYVSVELMNPQIWQIPPRQFGEIAMTALRKVLGQASMGEAAGAGASVSGPVPGCNAPVEP